MRIERRPLTRPKLTTQQRMLTRDLSVLTEAVEFTLQDHAARLEGIDEVTTLVQLEKNRLHLAKHFLDLFKKAYL